MTNVTFDKIHLQHKICASEAYVLAFITNDKIEI